MSGPCAKIAAKIATLGLLLLAGCSHGQQSRLPLGEPAYSVIPAKVERDESVLIRPGDRLYIRVLGEPELSSDQYRVDAIGSLQLPLLGPISTSGLTLAQLQETIRQQLGRRFIRDPQVAISTVSRSPAVFTVEGQVREPGIFEAAPDTTLLSAVAQAKSPTRVARLSDVAILRSVNGQPMGARFDLEAIRKGNAPDPQILAGDKVVVGFSQTKGAWRDLLEAAPLFNLFYLLR